MSWELEQMYLDRRTGRVKESALRKEAVDLPSPILSFSEIKEQFGTAGTYKTTVQGIPVKIDVGYAYNHLSPNNNTHFEDRTRISGALYETLHNPFLIVKTQKGFTFYKPFRDGDKTLHLTSLHIDEKGKAKYKTFYEVNNLKKILEIIKTPERNVKFFSHSSRNQKKETSKPSDAPDSSPVPVGNPNDKKIIHKQAEFVNDIQQNTQIKKGNNMAANSNPTSSKKTYADHVSEKIIEAIEAGTAPWMRKWKGSELYGRSPYNGASDKPYKGINAVNLMITANALGYSDPRWLTYKQAQSIDAQVRKGERGTVIQYWKFEERRDVVDDNGKPVLDEKGKPKKETVKLENPKVYFSTVFNAEQIENMPELKLESPLDFKPNETAENVLRNSGAEIEHKAGMSAYYMPGADKIVLPEKEQFVDEAGYYATALHELGHWTGHESRLDRDLSGNFGSESYAKEELRAEIGSYMLSSKLGIDFDPGNHYSYVDSWLKSLKEDKHEIFRAARDAETISDYVMDLSLGKNITHEEVAEKESTMTEAQHAWVQKKLDAGEPIYLNSNRVIMENLRGGTVESVK
jgi:antirestriction protein ArdC